MAYFRWGSVNIFAMKALPRSIVPHILYVHGIYGNFIVITWEVNPCLYILHSSAAVVYDICAQEH